MAANITINNKTVAENLRDVPTSRALTPGRDPSISNPMYAEGHLAILRATSHRAPWPRSPASNPVITGPARVFDDEQSGHHKHPGRQDQELAT